MSEIKSRTKKEDSSTVLFDETGKDFRNSDMLHLEKEVKEMMETVKNIHIKLSQNVVLGDKLECVTLEGNKRQLVSGFNEKDLQNYLEEIDKMDAVIKMKMGEEKKAKLSRIQEEEESRSILSEFTNCKMSEAIKLNGQQYINLLNEKIDCAEQQEAAKENIQIRSEEEEKLKKCESQQPTFIERNIQLAGCGRGILSLTKDEELRIQNLLQEFEDSNPNCKISNNNISEDNSGLGRNYTYGFDDELKSTLSQIDEKLQVFSNLKSLQSCSSKLTLLSKEVVDEIEEQSNATLDKKETVKSQKNVKNIRKNKKKFMKNRLSEINKLLSYINSVSSEEISPLSQEDIDFLIDEARLSLEMPITFTQNENDLQTVAKCTTDTSYSRDVITELVTNAKYLMPKFKYRFDES